MTTDQADAARGAGILHTTVDRSRDRAARIVGLLLLLSPITIIGVSYGIVWPLVSGVDAATAARNIVANEPLFRVGIVGNLLYAVQLVVLSAALYVTLRVVDPLLALLAALGRLFHAVTWVAMCINVFAALRLLTDPEYAQALPAPELQVFARLFLSGFDRYYIALLFWSLGTMAAATAWLLSREIPRPLAAFGILSSAWAVFCTVSLFLDPGFQRVVHLGWFDMPLLVFELGTAGLLLVRGASSANLR
jgi:hypothetical protein